MNVTRDEIDRIVNECIDRLLTQELILLKNDVSERAITHKVAEYLQQRVTYLNVDCEYNRNVTKGKNEPKRVQILCRSTQEKIESNPELEDCLEVSTYPDIIIHRRGTNAENLLVVEVKKRNSKIDHQHDYDKLKAFTENSEANSYHYRYGVFILLDTGKDKPDGPKLTWFVNGDKEENA